ncbi:DUF4097 family beta strand repeat-containing protein [Lachnospiraceae bacterium 46-61]
MKKKLISFLLSIFCIIVLPITTFAVDTEIEQKQKEQKTIIAKQITISEKEFANIEKLQIFWARGQVTINKSSDKNIYITERAYVMPKESETVSSFIKNDTLTINDNNSLPYLSIKGSMNTEQLQKLLKEYYNTEYDLEIALPEKQYKELYFKTTNADCILENHIIDTIISETVNGTTKYNNIKANTINSNSINGDIILYSDVQSQQYHLKSVNGNIDAVFSVFPTSVFTNTVNGNITLTLPENDGFSINKSKLKTTKNLNSSFSLKDANNKKIYKNGKTVLDIVCINGIVTLKKLENI